MYLIFVTWRILQTRTPLFSVAFVAPLGRQNDWFFYFEIKDSNWSKHSGQYDPAGQVFNYYIHDREVVQLNSL